MATPRPPEQPDHVTLEVDRFGQGRVVLNGEELRGVRRCEISCGVGELTVVTIEFSATVTATAGVARLARRETDRAQVGEPHG